MRIRAGLQWLLLLLVLGLALRSANGAERATETATDWADCLACHEDPDRELPALSDLRPVSSGTELGKSCLDCHEAADISLADPDWRHPLRSVAAHLSCTDCHIAEPHSADKPPSLPGGDYVEEACYSCHRSVEAERQRFSRHGAAGGISCRACHPAHGEASAALPKTLLPLSARQAREGIYDWRASNGDCLSCHSAGELTLSRDRGFVDSSGGNYHELHLIGETMCIECHEPHGSLKKGMLRERLLTGEIFSFREELEGGSCAITCHGVEHRRVSYDGGR